MAIRRIDVDIVKLAEGIIPGTKEGDHLLSFPGGVQFIVPEAVIDNLDPKADDRPAPKTEQVATAMVDKEDINPGQAVAQVEDHTTKVCIECGVSTKDVMPSGKCFNCAQVKCPTCKQPTTRADMVGQYCPNCLRRNKAD